MVFDQLLGGQPLERIQLANVHTLHAPPCIAFAHRPQHAPPPPPAYAYLFECVDDVTAGCGCHAKCIWRIMQTVCEYEKVLSVFLDLGLPLRGLDLPLCFYSPYVGSYARAGAPSPTRARTQTLRPNTHPTRTRGYNPACTHDSTHTCSHLPNEDIYSESGTHGPQSEAKYERRLVDSCSQGEQTPQGGTGTMPSSPPTARTAPLAHSQPSMRTLPSLHGQSSLHTLPSTVGTMSHSMHTHSSSVHTLPPRVHTLPTGVHGLSSSGQENVWIDLAPADLQALEHHLVSVQVSATERVAAASMTRVKIEEAEAPREVRHLFGSSICVLAWQLEPSADTLPCLRVYAACRDQNVAKVWLVRRESVQWRAGEQTRGCPSCGLVSCDRKCVCVFDVVDPRPIDADWWVPYVYQTASSCACVTAEGDSAGKGGECDGRKGEIAEEGNMVNYETEQKMINLIFGSWGISMCNECGRCGWADMSPKIEFSHPEIEDASYNVKTSFVPFIYTPSVRPQLRLPFGPGKACTDTDTQCRVYRSMANTIMIRFYKWGCVIGDGGPVAVLSVDDPGLKKLFPILIRINVKRPVFPPHKHIHTHAHNSKVGNILAPQRHWNYVFVQRKFGVVRRNWNPATMSQLYPRRISSVCMSLLVVCP